MAPSPSSKSTSKTETVRGEHRFNITGFSREVQRATSGPATFLTSDTFSVAGLDWAICFYPAAGFDELYVSVYVRLTTADASARALFDLRLVDRATGSPHSVRRSREPVAFVANKAKKRQRGARAFMSRSELAASPYLRDDRLTVECVLDVVREPRLTPTAAVSAEILFPPPSDLWKHLGQLMRTQEGADVTFDVQGEAFHAHRVVLAARSPVFKVELLSGSTSTQPDLTDITSEIVTVPDMRAPVFKALLHFIYTDTLPSLDDLGGVEEHQELVQDLLKAADRYAMVRLKRICTLILHNSLDWKTMADVLAFAGRHYRCEALGDACVQFMPSAGTEG